MNMQEIIRSVRGFTGALAVIPEEGSAFPELAWGDAFFYYAPDGRMPERTQPYGTIITKDYPDDAMSALGPDRFRVNIHVGRECADALVAAGAQATETDTFFRHPIYGDAGWVCVIAPAERTTPTMIELLRSAHESARLRADRRAR